jgi:hypothetical protein
VTSGKAIVLRFPAHLLIAASAAIIAAPVLAVPPAGASANPAIRQGPLSANELRVVRGIGRTVLVAKRTGADAADITALRADIESLAIDFDRAKAATLATPPTARKIERQSTQAQPQTLNSPPATYRITRDANGQLQSQEAVVEPAVLSVPSFVPSPVAQGVPVQGSDPFTKVRNRLDQIRTKLQYHIDEAQAKNDTSRVARGQALAETIDRLKAELQTATAEGATDVPAKLASLRRHLQVQGRADLSVTPEAEGTAAPVVEPTPTLTTMPRRH